MNVACPRCGSRYLKPQPSRTWKEALQCMLGVCSLSCTDCRFRFVARTWNLSWLRFARCPKCLRMDLSSWGEDSWFPSDFTRFLLTAGAKPYRCEYCRLNFVSFRGRKEKFRFDRWKTLPKARASNAREHEMEVNSQQVDSPVR